MKTLTYASRDGKDLLLDLYLPQEAHGPLPVIVFLHGGGWSGGTRTTGPDFKRFFAQDGFAMASIEYRLTPSVTFPGNVEDVKTAVRWLRANARPLWRSTPRRIATLGHVGGRASRRGRRAVAARHVRRHGQPRSVERGAVRARRLRSRDVHRDGRADRKRKGHAAAARAGVWPTRHQWRRRRHAPVRAGAAAGTCRASRPAPRRGRPGRDDTTTRRTRRNRAWSAPPIQTVPDRVRAASPLTYVAAGAPPFLLMHGLADNSVPHHQSVHAVRGARRRGQHGDAAA